MKGLLDSTDLLHSSLVLLVLVVRISTAVIGSGFITTTIPYTQVSIIIIITHVISGYYRPIQSGQSGSSMIISIDCSPSITINQSETQRGPKNGNPLGRDLRQSETIARSSPSNQKSRLMSAWILPPIFSTRKTTRRWMMYRFMPDWLQPSRIIIFLKRTFILIQKLNDLIASPFPIS